MEGKQNSLKPFIVLLGILIVGGTLFYLINPVNLYYWQKYAPKVRAEDRVTIYFLNDNSMKSVVASNDLASEIKHVITSVPEKITKDKYSDLPEVVFHINKTEYILLGYSIYIEKDGRRFYWRDKKLVELICALQNVGQD